MRSVDTSELHIKRIGDRAIVAPAYELETIREALQDKGTYPKVVGDIVGPEVLEEDEEEEASEEEADSNDEDQQEGE